VKRGAAGSYWLLITRLSEPSRKTVRSATGLGRTSLAVHWHDKKKALTPPAPTPIEVETGIRPFFFGLLHLDLFWLLPFYV
jgi:hypothetical protein